MWRRCRGLIQVLVGGSGGIVLGQTQLGWNSGSGLGCDHCQEGFFHPLTHVTSLEMFVNFDGQ